MNVDQQEIQKFSDIASTWWDQKGAFKPLHQLNPLRTDWITEHACGLFNKTVLDVGCGGGILSESLARRQAIVTGIDASDKAIQVARAHAQDHNLVIDYQHSTAESWAEKNPAQYDVVSCMELLEHVPEPDSVVRACAELVKPGGTVFFSTLNRTLKSRVLAIGMAEYVLGLVPRGTHAFDKFICPSELVTWCEQSGLKAKAMSGVAYNPVFETFKLTQNVDVNYMIFCEKPKDDAF